MSIPFLVFSLSVLLIGNVCLFLSTIASNQVFAQGATHVSQQHFIHFKPRVTATTQRDGQSENSAISQQQQKTTGSQSTSFNHRDKAGAISVAPSIAPQDINISSDVAGGPTYKVGQTLTFGLIAANISSTTTIDATFSIHAYDLIPLGLTNITAVSSAWSITISATTGPSLLSATYSGPPIAPGDAFAPITLSGTLTSAAVPVITNTVAISDKTNPNSNLSTFSLSVAPTAQTPTPTVAPTITPTPTVPPTITPTPTVPPTITPTPTVPPTTTVTTTPVPSSTIGISLNAQGGPTYQVGQTLKFDIIVTNNSQTPLDATSGVSFGDLIPLGLSNIVTSGNDWNINSTATDGPVLLSATYSGPPIAPGATLPPFEISGTLTSDAAPLFSNTAGVIDSQNPTPTTTMFNLTVTPATQTATVTPTVAATTTITPTVPATTTVTTTPAPSSTIGISLNAQGGPTYQVGQTLTFDMIVTNNSQAPLDATSGVRAGGLVPLGLSNIIATGNDWTIDPTGTNGPVIISAAYSGPPVAPGASFSPFEISGTLTSDAAPLFSVTAGVIDSQNPTPTTAMFNLTVTPATQTATVTPTIAATTTVTPTVPATTTVTTTPTPSSTIGISLNAQGGPTYQVGQTLTFDVIVTNNSQTPLDATSGIRLGDLIPLGLSNIVTSGNAWTIHTTGTIGPVLISAAYSGPPVAPGATLSPFEISGILTSDAAPVFSNSAVVIDTQHPTTTTATFNLTVTPATQTATATPTITVTSSPTTLVTPTITVTSSPTTLVTPTITVTSSPTTLVTPTATTIATATPTPAINLSIEATVLGATSFQIGQPVAYQVQVTNLDNSLPILGGTPITVDDVIPVGLTNISAIGSGWTINVSSPLGPSLIVATYNGSYPITTGTLLPLITITGTFATNALPAFTNTAGLIVPGNTNANTNSTVNVVVTSVSTITPTTSVPTATTSVPTATTSVPTATAIPHLDVIDQAANGDTFRVGDQVTFIIAIQNERNSGDLTTPIQVADILPIGLSNLSAKGFLWSLELSDTTSPARFNATFIPTSPIKPGDALPFLFITGTLTQNALDQDTNTGVFTQTANAMVQGAEAEATNAIFVEEQQSPLLRPGLRHE